MDDAVAINCANPALPVPAGAEAALDGTGLGGSRRLHVPRQVIQVVGLDGSSGFVQGSRVSIQQGPSPAGKVLRCQLNLSKQSWGEY